MHKSQGQTMDRAVINLGKSESTAGLTSVCLSRAKRFVDSNFCAPVISRAYYRHSTVNHVRYCTESFRSYTMYVYHSFIGSSVLLTFSDIHPSIFFLWAAYYILSSPYYRWDFLVLHHDVRRSKICQRLYNLCIS